MTNEPDEYLKHFMEIAKYGGNPDSIPIYIKNIIDKLIEINQKLDRIEYKLGITK